MFEHSTKVRVRYGETDQMGYLYYGNYALYYEVGRVEALRSVGIIYKNLEEKHGIWMPVMELNVKYIQPVFYDEEVRIRTRIKEMPRATITFFHDLFNEKDEMINRGSVQLCFINADHKRPVRLPEFIHNALKPYFV